MNPNNPSPTVPPLSTLNQVLQVVPLAPVPIQPVVRPRPRFPKRLIYTIVLVAIIVIFGGLVSKFILPLLGGGSSSQNASLIWWGLFEDQSSVNSLIAAYQKDHPNVKIEYKLQSQPDYRERLTSSLNKGTGPDIYTLHNTWVPMLKKYLYPIPEKVMSTEDFLQTFYPVASSDLILGKQILAIPLQFDSLALYINDEIFQTYNKPIPQTWDEVKQTAKELTLRDENGVIRQAGIAMGTTQNVDYWQEIVGLLMYQNKVDFKNPAKDPTAVALDYYSRFSREDKVWDGTQPSSTIAFAGGRVAMYFAPASRIAEIKQQNPSLRFRVVTAPQLPKQTPTDPNVFYSTYWAHGVWSESRQKDAAWEFLKFMTSRESLLALGKKSVYPRRDMQDELKNDPLLGAFALQGQEAKSWYLSSRTFDGATGINSRLSILFEDAINSINAKKKAESVLADLATGIIEIFADWGLIPRPAATPKK